MHDTDGSLIAYMIISKDVTDIETIKSGFKANEQRMLEALDFAPVAVINMDEKGLITYVKGKILTDQGFPEDYLLGKSINAKISGAPDFTHHFHQAMTGKATQITF